MTDDKSDKKKPTRAKKQYGKWRIVRSLSEGGQAKTFIVVEEGAEEKGEFVLKRFLKPRIQRHQNEVRACLQLSHPNVIKVEDYNLNHESYYLVTEYCSSGALDKADITAYPIIDRLRLFT